MSRHQPLHPNSHRTQRPARKDWLPLAGIGLAVLAVAVIALWLASVGGSANPQPAKPGVAEAAVPMPIANEPQTAAGVQVKSPAVDRGRLPLNTTVSQSYELMNTGSSPVQIGTATIQVMDGCCPPDPQVSQSVLQPGDHATVRMIMQMHPGMDGPHLFHLTVPVRGAGGEEALHLYFKGDFEG